ncbi:hypothetical protein [Mumia quercus]|uniref:hypothetical protein n=1 Tax=Mumia quercus TaxID=2976125 RepID=UPI0021D1C0D3|nr:hypothetical protein [Mumia quercus]
MSTSLRDARRAPARRHRQVRDAAFLGLALQVLVTALPVLDLAFFGTLDAHVREAYPAWPDSEVAADRNAIAWGLVIIGVLGTAGWLLTALVASRGRAVRAVVTTLFVTGTCVTLYAATLSGDAYDLVVPLWLGIPTVALPLLAGVTATLAAWWPAD